MKKTLLCVILLSAMASGQVTIKGRVVYRGAGSGTSAATPPPLAVTYLARTDACNAPDPVNCPGTTGQANSSLEFRGRDSDPLPFGNLAPLGTAFTDHDFSGYEMFVTDRTTLNPWTIFNMGSQGNWDAFSTDDHFLLVNINGGAMLVYYIDLTGIQNQSCGSGVANCVIYTGITGMVGTPSNQALTNGGTPNFSRNTSEPDIIFEYDGDTKINRFQIKNAAGTGPCTKTDALTQSCTLDKNPANGNGVLVDFAANSPVPCAVLPGDYAVGWDGTFSVSNTSSVTIALGGGPLWHASTAVTTDMFIMPLQGSCGSAAPQCSGYHVTVAGTTSTTQPTWSTCKNKGDVCTEAGGVQWTNVGKLSAQGNAFDFVNYRPGKGCARWNTYTGKITRSAGSVEPTGQITTDDEVWCAIQGTTPCNLPEQYQIHDGEQYFDGGYAGVGATGAEQPCANQGFGFNCSCGTSGEDFDGVWSNTFSYDTHSTVGASDKNMYQSLQSPNVGHDPTTSPTWWKQVAAYCDTYYWQVNSTIVRPCQGFSGSACAGHSAKGYLNDYRGKQYTAHGYGDPVKFVSGVIHAQPGQPMYPQSFSYDNHGSYRNAGTNDTTPMSMAPTDVPSITSGFHEAGYQEVVTVYNSVMYRYGHNFNTSSNANFSGQNNIGVISFTGRLYAWGSDAMGTRGGNSLAWASNKARAIGDTINPANNNANFYEFKVTAITTGTNSNTEPNWDSVCSSTCVDGGVTWTNTHKQCNGLRADLPAATNTPFTLNTKVFSVINNGNDNIYNTTTAGTTGNPLPNWGSVCPNYGDTCTSGTAVFTNIGPNTCRTDIMLMDLTSSHPKP